MSRLFAIRRVFPLAETERCVPAEDGRFVRAYTERRLAEECRAALDRAAHLRPDINPFEFDWEMGLCSRFTPSILYDWLLDAGVTPPEDALEWMQTWRDWWRLVQADLTELQGERLWQGLDKVHCFEIVEADCCKVAHAGWRYGRAY